VIFQSPELDDADLAVLAYFNAQRAQLRAYAQSSPKRWMGLLRRNTFARGILASNAIDGIQASMENVLAAIENEEPAGIERDAWLATKGCRDAMVCINQAATDPHFELSRQFLKSLHFMVTGRDLTVNPGQWRPGPIHIVNRATGKIVHEGPDAALVNSLMQELVDYLRSPLREPCRRWCWPGKANSIRRFQASRNGSRRRRTISPFWPRSVTGRGGLNAMRGRGCASV